MRARTSQRPIHVETTLADYASCVAASMAEVATICRRAFAAADTWERLRRLSDAGLAARGLARADLPRATFETLTRRR